ncbi:LysE family translocator [Haematobacter massiliensis]|uniref:Amino acid transporter LysE n=1 Tax=Haematobacter massiliensis TaxID=195105 RepID=A0A086Y857_9RHOB|nr:LysE family translocator [Haematobacter massiliensis]KFI30457.1 amino acid transporter LysE [Haematobacter massiliensis]OWJ70936.1 LysE family translocator [Haematobacter massiliensis]OWJ87477.1 LysE family translocator [Haematobacter massiliensis]QBJ24930.1 LysE family translocator [Haematobacter massiliensis]
MSLTIEALWLYAGALFVLWLTPGPVFVAITARALSGGFSAAWPLALGVTVGDMLWPLVAAFGMAWFIAANAWALDLMRWVAVAMFLWLGWGLIRNAGAPPDGDSRLARPGLWSGFSAGVMAILGNPKAILFYMAVLPGFFDLSRAGAVDLIVIVAVSAAVPLAGNLITAAAVSRARTVLSSPSAMARTNRIAGALLILVGGAIAFL